MSNKKISIGRNPVCTISVDERWDTVSNNHADIELDGDRLVFHDHSSNGTYIDNKKIHLESVEIHPGSDIKLAGAYTLDWETLKYHFPEYFSAQQPQTPSGDGQSFGHKTVKFSSDATGGNNGQHGRKTEAFSGKPGSGQDGEDTRYEDTKERFGVENKYSQADIDQALEQWSWGGFFCSWLYALVHKKYWPMLILLLVPIPYLGVVASLFLCVHLGMTGSRMAWGSGIYSDFDAYMSARKKWTLLGVLWFLLAIAVNAFCIYYVLSI